MVIARGRQGQLLVQVVGLLGKRVDLDQLSGKSDLIPIGVGCRQGDRHGVLRMRHRAVADQIEHGRCVGHGDGERLAVAVDPIANHGRYGQRSGEPVGRIDQEQIPIEAYRGVALIDLGQIGKIIAVGVRGE